MEFGAVLRELRQSTNVGQKKLAPELGVSYTYLSKLENGQVRPSEQFVQRVAAYFDQDPTLLLLAANYVPEDVMAILRTEPDKAVALLRERFGRVAHDRSAT